MFSFPANVCKINGEHDYIVFPGGCMKAFLISEGVWKLDFIWDSKYGTVNSFAQKWVQRQLEGGCGTFSTSRVEDIINTLLGAPVKEEEYA